MGGTLRCPVNIAQGDCLALLQELPDSSVDMVLCDPPYGTTQCAWDIVIPFDRLWAQYDRVVKLNGAVVLFAAQPFTTDLINSNRKNFRYLWYWRKNNVTGGPFAKVQPMRCIEEIAVFYRRSPTYNPRGLVRLKKPRPQKARSEGVYGEFRGNPQAQEWTNYPNHLLEIAGEHTVGRLHPTQKPVKLLEYLVRTYTDPGETVLDNCMGSGGTGVACVNTGRRFIGMEMDAGYFEIARNRIEEAAHGGKNQATL